MIIAENRLLLLLLSKLFDRYQRKNSNLTKSKEQEYIWQSTQSIDDSILKQTRQILKRRLEDIK